MLFHVQAVFQEKLFLLYIVKSYTKYLQGTDPKIVPREGNLSPTLFNALIIISLNKTLKNDVM